MKPHIAKEVPDAIWKQFQTVQRIIDKLPDHVEVDAYIFGLKVERDVAVGTVVPSCHHIARALAEHLPVVIHDGGVLHINKTLEHIQLDHSWLTVQGQDQRWIIDPWPLGVVSGPALFLQDYAFHFMKLDTSDCRLDNHFIEIVEAISSHIDDILVTT